MIQKQNMNKEMVNRLQADAEKFYETIVNMDELWSEYLNKYPILEEITVGLFESHFVKDALYYFTDDQIEQLKLIKRSLVLSFEFLGFDTVLKFFKESTVGSIIETICVYKVLTDHPQLNNIDIRITMLTAVIGGVTEFTTSTDSKNRALELVDMYVTDPREKNYLLDFFNNQVDFVEKTLH
jgi:hypothetical protein